MNQATHFKEQIETLISVNPNMTVYETIGALEVVKMNLLELLGRVKTETQCDSAKIMCDSAKPLKH